MGTSIDAIIEQQRQKSDAAKEDEREINIPESEYFGLWKGAQVERNERYIDFRSRKGERITFDYPDRKFVSYNPERAVIEIDFGDCIMAIYGRGIEPLYDLILARKVEWVREADNPEKDDSEDLPIFIEAIDTTFNVEEPEKASPSNSKTKTKQR